MANRHYQLGMSEIWICFSCCTTEQPQTKRRRRIDRSMIGNPSDFRHTGHIGSGDMSTRNNHLTAIQVQMGSKGGYEHAIPVNATLVTADLNK